MLLLVLFIILLDQIIKYFVSTNMFLGQSIPVLPQIFHLTYSQNPGAAFGILENQRYLFILIAAVLIVAVIYFYKKIIQLSKLFQVGIALLFGGAIGNYDSHKPPPYPMPRPAASRLRKVCGEQAVL